ncbi:hypothetical protein PIB30_110290, partial [Stylosanthes scabra]|nr:hypothetical protein [Stylosanthes scabra]
FPEVRTTELFVEIVDLLASSGSSAPNPLSLNVGGPSCYGVSHETDMRQVASLSSDINLQAEAAGGGHDVGDSCSFGELAAAMAANLVRECQIQILMLERL